MEINHVLPKWAVEVRPLMADLYISSDPAHNPDYVHTSTAPQACPQARCIPIPSSPTQGSKLERKNLSAAFLRGLTLECVVIYQQNKLFKTLIFQQLLVNKFLPTSSVDTVGWDTDFQTPKQPTTIIAGVWLLSEKNKCYYSLAHGRSQHFRGNQVTSPFLRTHSQERQSLQWQQQVYDSPIKALSPSKQRK